MTNRAQLAGLLGAGFPEQGLQSVILQGKSECHGWVLEDILFTDAAAEAIPAFFLRPPNGHAAEPALVYCHAHENCYGLGRNELVEGRPPLHSAYANDLVANNIAALCIEMPCFGARENPDETARPKSRLWRGETLIGQMLAEQMGGIGFLAGHPVVQADQIKALGFSMGSTLA